MLLPMCGSDTFTTVVSSTSMKVASITATATIHGLAGVLIRDCYGGPLPSASVDGGRHRHARPQQVIRVLAGVEHDLHRHPLDHLDEVAAGVLGRQQAEARPRGRGDAFHLALEGLPAVGVDLDVGHLPYPHAVDLRLLEVG